MKGEIKTTWLISNPDGKKFHDDLKRALEDEITKNLFMEIQYSIAMNDGGCVYSALLIGRAQ